MSDHFALLNEPRRPWLDPDRLKEKFLALAAPLHPDRIHQSPPAERDAATRQYSELNAAYNCLRDPKDRLRHLLELELGHKPADIQTVPPEMMDSHFTVAKFCRDVDQFLAESAKVTSPLVKVQFFERAQDWTEKLQGLQKQITTHRDELLAELQSLNPFWETRAELPLARLDAIYRLFGYLSRWLEQIQERLVQLSLSSL